MDKERLDVLLVNKGFFPSREKARKSIMAGLVFINNQRVDKAGEMINADSKVEVRGNALPYVSRGGLKLEKAIKEFNLDISEKNVMDIGASTGGFTDCFLQNGASRVYAIDVGYGQFAWELRVDSRVTLMERTNIRYVKPEDIGMLCDIAAIDVSFISLKLVLPVVKNLINNNGEIICLIKPQFEAGREKVGKKGVVRDAAVHKEVIENILNFCISNNLNPVGLTYSPIKGPEGNIEYLLYLVNHASEEQVCSLLSKVDSIVQQSHDRID